MQFSVKNLAVMLLLVNFFMLASMALATASVSLLHQPE
jgi:cyclic lactone autoinducer peptide